MTAGMLQTLYRGLTRIGGPAIRYYLHRRRRVGKEDVARQGERLGQAARARPEGPLVWFHGASVGESLSILTLVNRMLAGDPCLQILVTTGTVTSAQLMGQRLPARAFHQFMPVDRPDYVSRFLNHWRPDLALWIESEIWPNMLWEIRRRGIRAALINARMSERSFARWRKVPRFIEPLLGAFRLCLAQTSADADRLNRLGGNDVRTVGNLKFAAEPPPANEATLAALHAAVADRPVWLLASSHPGEDELAAEVHAVLARRLPGLLTVIAPRHPHRGGAIAEMAAGRGLHVARRSTGALPSAEDQLYIADTMGEMGVFYRVAPVVCIGGSLVPHGGQNPIEPAQTGCAVLFGPHMTNFAEIAAELIAAGAARMVADVDALADTVGGLLTDAEDRKQAGEAARVVTGRHSRVADMALTALAPLLAEAGVKTPVAEAGVKTPVAEAGVKTPVAEEP
ncbi:MAG: 3-deoxy-D-manno-octulosonic acid transferase [Rhodospirillaceae bacterium]